jgi:hypothetical protein
MANFMISHTILKILNSFHGKILCPENSPTPKNKNPPVSGSIRKKLNIFNGQLDRLFPAS